ncbi:MAG: hypothetical protein ACR2LI_00025 [Propionibacteriaceae bacterium]
MRGIDVGAPAELLFRWVGQLRVAPYSHDWIDDLGRRSPRGLTPHLAPVAVGDHVMIGEVVDLTPGVQFPVLTSGRGRLLFGRIALTYEVARAATTRPGCCPASPWAGRVASGARSTSCWCEATRS